MKKIILKDDWDEEKIEVSGFEDEEELFSFLENCDEEENPIIQIMEELTHKYSYLWISSFFEKEGVHEVYLENDKFDLWDLGSAINGLEVAIKNFNEFNIKISNTEEKRDEL